MLGVMLVSRDFGDLDAWGFGLGICSGDGVEKKSGLVVVVEDGWGRGRVKA